MICNNDRRAYRAKQIRYHHHQSMIMTIPRYGVRWELDRETYGWMKGIEVEVEVEARIFLIEIALLLTKQPKLCKFATYGMCVGTLLSLQGLIRRWVGKSYHYLLAKRKYST